MAIMILTISGPDQRLHTSLKAAVLLNLIKLILDNFTKRSRNKTLTREAYDLIPNDPGVLEGKLLSAIHFCPFDSKFIQVRYEDDFAKIVNPNI